jgi:predicted PurR-regulated permease PerM
MHRVEDKTFLLLIVAVSVAFAMILWPFFGPVLWATVLAIVFAPLYRRLSPLLRRKRSIAALVTLFIILVMVILPLALVAAALVQEASGVYRRVQAGEIHFGKFFEQMVAGLPGWAVHLLERFGLTNFGAVQERLSEALTKGSHFLATQAISIGQNAFSFLVSLFVMLYLLFFLLRDGDDLFKRVRKALPLRSEQLHQLFSEFAAVVRATVKGNIVIAILQGVLGGIIFWILGAEAPLLWGGLMAVLSLVPAVGSALVWAPAGVYFLATGALLRGVVLIAFGVFVIGLVDNIVRPILVGRDIKMPDYLVLISTLGGIAVFGVNGFVIGPLIAAMFISAWDMLSEAKSA